MFYNLSTDSGFINISFFFVIYLVILRYFDIFYGIGVYNYHFLLTTINFDFRLLKVHLELNKIVCQYLLYFETIVYLSIFQLNFKYL